MDQWRKNENDVNEKETRISFTSVTEDLAQLTSPWPIEGFAENVVPKPRERKEENKEMKRRSIDR